VRILESGGFGWVLVIGGGVEAANDAVLWRESAVGVRGLEFLALDVLPPTIRLGLL